MDLTGAQRFARFAYPPNAEGLCGPDSAADVYALATEDGTTELLRLAKAFEGAYPYLELLAGSNGCTDPLDAQVVEAYWIGNELVDRVSTFDFGRSIDDRFRRRSGRDWDAVVDRIPDGCANHSFHVLSMSPWVGLLRAGLVDEAITIVDDCRISWGRVTHADASTLTVDRTPLRWIGGQLVFGSTESTVIKTLVAAEPGDVVAIHWGWACETLSQRQLTWLEFLTRRQLRNARLARDPVGRFR